MASETTTSFSGNQLIDGILWGRGFSTSQAVKWNTTNIDFSFSGAWQGFEQNAVNSALNLISNATGLTFSAGSGSTDLTFLLASEPTDPTLGIGIPPDTYFFDQSITGAVVWNTGFPELWNSTVHHVGGIGFSTIIHEIMHSLGLGHPHDNSFTLPGVSSISDTGDFGLNSNLYTSMSDNVIAQSIQGIGQVTPGVS